MSGKIRFRRAKATYVELHRGDMPEITQAVVPSHMGGYLEPEDGARIYTTRDGRTITFRRIPKKRIVFRKLGDYPK